MCAYRYPGNIMASKDDISLPEGPSGSAKLYVVKETLKLGEVSVSKPHIIGVRTCSRI